MYILGIGPGIKLGHHNASATLLKNGRIVCACEEDRFRGEKHSRARFPKRAIDFCLKHTGISMEDISFVASPLATYTRYEERIALLFKFHYKQSPPVKLYHHHLCHAASSYLVSGIDEALIVTLDYSGDSASGLIARGKGPSIEPLEFLAREHSIGMFYSMITQFLGFRAHEDEYKVMGLASYGEPCFMEEMSQIVWLDKNRPVLNGVYNQRIRNRAIFTTDFTTFQEQSYTNELCRLLGEPRLAHEPLTQRHKDLAASLQRHIERIVCAIIGNEIQKIPCRSLCLAGGLALNCKLNYELIQSKLFDRVFIQPAASDAGISLGAALLCAQEHGVLDFENPDIVYLGPSFSGEHIEAYLNQCKLAYTRVDNPTVLAAKLIAENKIVGWFQGRAEWGPRALGNRSILANPARTEMRDLVNQKIKFREEFRPFAPSILKEHYTEYFEGGVGDPYMTTVARVVPEREAMIPAVIHVDKTARPQVVCKKQNNTYWTLISELKRLTGIPVVLNTSLNLSGQPMAARPSEAVRVFFGSGMDVLFLGNYVLAKEAVE